MNYSHLKWSMKSSTILLFILGICIQAVQAIEVRFIAVEKGLGDIYYLNDEGDYTKTNLSPYEVSEALNVGLAEGKVRIFRQTLIEDRLVYETIAEADPGSLRKALGVIHNQAKVWRLGLFDNSTKAFPNRTFRIINLLPVPIATRVGKTPVKTKPYGVEVVSVAPPGPRPVVGIVAAYQKEGNWVPFFDKPVGVLPNARVTGIATVTRHGMDLAYGTDLEDLSGEPRVDYFLLHDRL
jgi:hypothetical protein